MLSLKNITIGIQTIIYIYKIGIIHSIIGGENMSNLKNGEIFINDTGKRIL